MTTIKRLDVPKWVKAEKTYYDFFGYTRRHREENESFEDYHSRVVSEMGYNKGVVMFPGKDGYFLVDNNLVVIQCAGLAWVSLNKDKINLFKQELKQHSIPTISSEVFNSLEVLSCNGLLKHDSVLSELYQINLYQRSSRMRLLNLKREKKVRMKIKTLDQLAH